MQTFFLRLSTGRNFAISINYVFAHFKMMLYTSMKTEILGRNLHAAGYWRTVIICTNVVDIILNIFDQVVDTLMKGFESSLH